MNGHDWKGYCPEHAVLVDRVQRNSTVLEGLDKDVQQLRVEVEVLRVKVALMVTAASMVGGFLGNLIMYWMGFGR